MLFASTTLPALDHASHASNMNTFHWLLILGFPVDLAAAKAMPELFSDAAPVPFTTDGVRVFLRDEPMAA